MTPLDRLRIEKAAADCGFEMSPEPVAGGLRLRSARFPERLIVRPGAFQGFLLEASNPLVLDAQDTGGTVSVEGYAALYQSLTRAAARARTLPNRVADRFRAQVSTLPRSTEAERLVVQRVGQDLFRSALLDYWQGKCCVTGLTVPELLRASHIKPWADCSADEERLDVFNGLLLAPNLDALFDGGWITFDDTGLVVVSTALPVDAASHLGVSAAWRIETLAAAHRGYLAYHCRSPGPQACASRYRRLVSMHFGGLKLMGLFEQECRAVGEACAAARMRLDEKAPDALKKAFRGYRGPKAGIDDYFERKWLSLRLSALKRGMVLDPTVSSDFLRRVMPRRCPATLEPFDMVGKSPRNPSVDRLVNEVTYLAGNVCALSLRANRAKGERTFEEVAGIAQAGVHRDGLAPLEWMRLASLMYGAWARAFKHADPHLLPLAAIPEPGMFMSTSQVVQLLLTRHYGPGAERPEEATHRWLSLTRYGGAREELFLDMQAALAAALRDEEEHPGNAWLHPGVFDAFVVWYNKASGAVIPAIEELLQHHQDRRADSVASLDWPTTGRYHH